MKQSHEPVLLWRVELVHRNGYQAPSVLLEAERSNVHKAVKGLHLRLLDFPKAWSYYPIVIATFYDAKRGKWTNIDHNRKRRQRRPRMPKKA